MACAVETCEANLDVLVSQHTALVGHTRLQAPSATACQPELADKYGSDRVKRLISAGGRLAPHVP